MWQFRENRERRETGNVMHMNATGNSELNSEKCFNRLNALSWIVTGGNFYQVNATNSQSYLEATIQESYSCQTDSVSDSHNILSHVLILFLFSSTLMSLATYTLHIEHTRGLSERVFYTISLSISVHYFLTLHTRLSNNKHFISIRLQQIFFLTFQLEF